MSYSKKSYTLVTGLLFVLAIGLLLFSTIGSARAALNVQSEILTSDFGMLNIGVDLTNEDGASVSGTGENSVLLKGMVGKNEKFKPGKIYDWPVYVTNTGTIDEYVRVVVYKYWLNSKGEKDVKYDTSLIKLGFDGAWTVESSAPSANGERTILYYTGGPLGKNPVKLLNTVQIDGRVMLYATQIGPEDPGGKKGVITTTYEYDGAQFCIEIEADGVQTHNAKDAIRSAWGKSVTVTDGGPITGGIG